MRTDDLPKLVVGCGAEPSTKSKIEGLLRKECHLDTVLAGKVTVAVVRADNPWGTLPTGADILLHPSIPRGLRENMVVMSKSGYGAITECRYETDFEKLLISRLRGLSLHWPDSVVEMLGHWSHDNGIDTIRVKEWANQFGSHLGGAILRSLRILRTNQLLPLTGITDFEKFHAILALTDEHGRHSGSEALLNTLLEKKKLEMLSLESLAVKSPSPTRVLVLADWLLSGRQFLSYLNRSADQFRKLSAGGTRFCLAAARTTELARLRIECAVQMLKIDNFTVREPTERFLPNLSGIIDKRLDPNSCMPLVDVGEGEIISEFELRLLEAGHGKETITGLLQVCAEIGYQLAYPGQQPGAMGKPRCWGLGDHGLGLTTLSSATCPAGLLPVLWTSGTVIINGKQKQWVPLIKYGE